MNWKKGGTGVEQSGLSLDGLAMTTPALAPEAEQPLEPMLQSRFRKAMGLSVEMNESTDLFRISVSRLIRRDSGRPRTAWKAKVPRSTRDEKACMMGSTRLVLLLRRSRP